MVGLAWLTLLLAALVAGDAPAQRKNKRNRREAAAAPGVSVAERESAYYRMVSFPYRDDFPVEVGALMCRSDGRIMVGTRTGDVWLLENAYDADPKNVRYHRWARGLGQPLGLLELDGWIYTAQRGELTRMKDSDGDGRADVFETVCDDWAISGNYHEYNFGPRLGVDGKLWVTTNKPFGPEPWGKAHWRGWAFTIDPETGVMKPMCAGLRSPAGVEVSPWGDAFYTDNQGEWCNASKLSHLEFGDFHGHPHGLISKELAGEPFASIPEPVSGTFMKDMHLQIPKFKMPAVWFPYDKMGKSPSGMCWDRSGGRFGPFSGQLFVGDQHHATVMRVCLEKVGGHWQGACIPFREGFQCGVTRICWGSDKSLFVGMTNAGWGGKGNKRWGLQRLVWTGEVPLEVLSMHARPDGFELQLTLPVDPAVLSDTARYRIESYTYKLEQRYGGPEADKKTVKVTRAVPGEDGKSVRLELQDLRAGYVHELHLDGMRTAAGVEMLHPAVYYTLVNIPER